MRKTILTALLAILSTSVSAKAAEDNCKPDPRKPSLSASCALKIQLAIQTLFDAGVISIKDEDQSINLDDMFLENLRKSGVITELDSKEGVVCIGAGN